MTHVTGTCALLLMLPLTAGADPLIGARAAYLEDAQGTRIHIADLAFEATGDYRFDMAEGPFTDHFLSMRPFRCLVGPDKHWCHVPYPYAIARQAGPDDLTDLEYDFLFIWKGATDYGIDMWNGVYYRIAPQGDRLVGILHEMDMDVLAIPPEAGNLRPVTDDDLEPGDPDSHWLPVLVIE